MSTHRAGEGVPGGSLCPVPGTALGRLAIEVTALIAFHPAAS